MLLLLSTEQLSVGRTGSRCPRMLLAPLYQNYACHPPGMAYSGGYAYAMGVIPAA
jgi:hypothetical protein